jgi:hypothetical protein
MISCPRLKRELTADDCVRRANLYLSKRSAQRPPADCCDPIGCTAGSAAREETHRTSVVQAEAGLDQSDELDVLDDVEAAPLADEHLPRPPTPEPPPEPAIPPPDAKETLMRTYCDCGREIRAVDGVKHEKCSVCRGTSKRANAAPASQHLPARMSAYCEGVITPVKKGDACTKGCGRPVKHPRSGLCKPCYQAEWLAKKSGKASPAKKGAARSLPPPTTGTAPNGDTIFFGEGQLPKPATLPTDYLVQCVDEARRRSASLAKALGI